MPRMTINLYVSPETNSRLNQQARKEGLPLDTFMVILLNASSRSIEAKLTARQTEQLEDAQVEIEWEEINP